jgi:2-polyprenyl-3-methyl-5-hydroxy-6-metoxy-1,4-benzoquinol methylase
MTIKQDVTSCRTLEVDLRNTSPSGTPERILPEDLSLAPDHLARYAFATHWAPGSCVADICCGIGYGSNLLAAAGASSVYAFDVSASAVAEANKRYGRPSVRFHCADATKPLSIPQVDLAICFEGIEHVVDARALLGNMAAALSDQGVAIISTPNSAFYPGGHSGNPFHLHEYEIDELTELLRGYFSSIKMYFQWSYKDPFDFEWNLASALRVLLPVPLKHAIRSHLRRRKQSPEAPEHQPLNGSAARYRPFPISYLSLRGLRFCQPAIWVAVCQGPLRNL